ncbi:AAA family ATPase [Yersinia enterocolitica]|uniref:AAA family ATPase n=1 Tax=Yersinia enterocolitica TaxID=630 RepID=UPI00155A238E|nr:AAA family ATPase [Yersinia enterocolitica]MBX9485812.1 AAA family ATPase [Yersinia enterocolitica]NQS96727.1 AAA family ATPase [Yersinia enterocolitica]NQT43404.1 AAA family ATPase [Yersinia enterocolitica]NQT98796.1 AAA family ATPase [Yersinia enterocolitica]HDM8448662.1 AAA family ATPase [Yersinia enterocolitica]
MTTIEKIADWSKKKPVWWRHSLRLALNNGTLEQDHFNEILELARMEHGLLEKNAYFAECEKPIDFTGYATELHEVSLKSLYDVKGVGLLAENQTLKFSNNGLFIVYGDNGAGKSSYASILKNACLTRGDSPAIIGNVFSKLNLPPQAKLAVSCNGVDEIHSWNQQASSVESLKSIRVFDSSSASHYINKEDALGFKPVGLNLLTELIRAIGSVNAFINEDIMPGNGLATLAKLQSGSVTASFINNLSASTVEGDIKKHIATDIDLQRIESLRREIIQYKSETAETIKSALEQNKRTLTPLKKFCDSSLNLLGNDAILALRKLLAEQERTQHLSEELRKATLQNLPLDTVAGLSWQDLWAAAKSFIEQETQKQSFPMQTGEHCPLCLQEISPESESRMAALAQYLSDKTAQSAKYAKDNFDDALKLLSSHSLELAPYIATLEFLNSKYPPMGDDVKMMFAALAVRKENISSGKVNGSHAGINPECVKQLNKVIENIDQSILSVTSDADLLLLIKREEMELARLEDIKYVSENLPNIISNIRRYKVIKNLENLQTQCGTTSISTLSSQISRSGVVEPLISAFSDELRDIGFERFKVKVDTRNRSGEQQFKLSLADENDATISTLGVASEGEQRCIAIASFLAEMKADARKSAVIFDDPVNSLSHEWSSRVARRLVLESQNRQVIILTHNIVFYKLLLEVAEEISVEYSSIALERSRKFAGLVRESAPWEAMTTRSRYKELKVKLQELKRLEKSDDTTSTEFRSASCQFYGFLREAWERLVEEKLLNKVVTRFERGIYTQRLGRLTDISQDDLDKINRGMSKCSTYFRGHDSATAVGAPYPTIAEIEQDLEAINIFLSELEAPPRKRN